MKANNDQMADNFQTDSTGENGSNLKDLESESTVTSSPRKVFGSNAAHNELQKLDSTSKEEGRPDGEFESDTNRKVSDADKESSQDDNQSRNSDQVANKTQLYDPNAIRE